MDNHFKCAIPRKIRDRFLLGKFFGEMMDNMKPGDLNYIELLKTANGEVMAMRSDHYRVGEWHPKAINQYVRQQRKLERAKAR